MQAEIGGGARKMAWNSTFHPTGSIDCPSEAHSSTGTRSHGSTTGPQLQRYRSPITVAIGPIEAPIATHYTTVLMLFRFVGSWSPSASSIRYWRGRRGPRLALSCSRFGLGGLHGEDRKLIEQTTGMCCVRRCNRPWRKRIQEWSWTRSGSKCFRSHLVGSIPAGG